MNRHLYCDTVTSFNASLLHSYADFLEASDNRESKKALEHVKDIYGIAKKAHETLGGRGSLDRISEEAEKIRQSTQGQDPYFYRQQLCEALMTAVIKTTGFHIPWDAYLQTAARAQVWLAYLEETRAEKEAS